MFSLLYFYTQRIKINSYCMISMFQYWQVWFMGYTPYFRMYKIKWLWFYFRCCLKFGYFTPMWVQRRETYLCKKLYQSHFFPKYLKYVTLVIQCIWNKDFTNLSCLNLLMLKWNSVFKAVFQRLLLTELS